MTEFEPKEQTTKRPEELENQATTPIPETNMGDSASPLPEREMEENPLEETPDQEEETIPNDTTEPEVIPDEPAVDTNETQSEARFDIEKYPDWHVVWESFPEQDRYLLAEMIEVGNITPEIYQKLNISVMHIEKDKKLNEIDPAYGEGNAAAEVSYAAREVRLFPEFDTRTERQKTHILYHEFGHFLTTHMTDPEEITPLIKAQPEWSNGKYIQKIGRDLPKRFIVEAAADYAADFLHSRSGEEMLMRRLMRAGAKEEFESKSEEEVTKLIAQNEEIFSYFKRQFSAERQGDEATELKHTQQWEWLRMLAAIEESELGEEMDYIEPVGPEVADELWQPPDNTGKQTKRSWIDWLFTAGLIG